MNIWQHSKADGCSDGQCLFMALYATIKWWAAEFWRGRTNLKKIKLKLSSKKTVEPLKMFVKSVSQHASNSCRFRHQHLLRKKTILHEHLFCCYGSLKYLTSKWRSVNAKCLQLMQSSWGLFVQHIVTASWVWLGYTIVTDVMQ